LTLLVPGILTNDPKHAVAPDDFALGTHFLNRRSDFHDRLQTVLINIMPKPQWGLAIENEAAIYTAFRYKEQARIIPLKG
jgi:hypothetical protein